MDRHQRKVEKQRKKKLLAKKNAQARLARRPSEEQRLLRGALRSEIGHCAISYGWDEDELPPPLVTVVATRRLPNGLLLPAVALIDRTCLGVKNGFIADPIAPRDLTGFLAEVGMAHGGMEECDAAVAQSVLFHAVDYAARLGFAPHPDVPLSMFGPRPEPLLTTPWCDPETPIYISGPTDDVSSIVRRLESAVGPGNFESVALDEIDAFDDDDDDEDGDWIEAEPLAPEETQRLMKPR